MPRMHTFKALVQNVATLETERPPFAHLCLHLDGSRVAGKAHGVPTRAPQRAL